MKDERRGFSGFDDMVSDLSDLPEAPPPPPPPPPAKEARSLDDDDKLTPGLKKTPEPKSGAKIFFIVSGALAALIGLAYVGSQLNTPTNSSPPATPKQTPPTTAIPSQPPAQLTELAPEPGQGGVVSIPQLRYCLSQNIRLDGAEKATDTTSQKAIDRFNGLATDYNSRCGRIWFRQSDFESINPGIVIRRAALEREGAVLVIKPSKPAAGR